MNMKIPPDDDCRLKTPSPNQLDEEIILVQELVGEVEFKENVGLQEYIESRKSGIKLVSFLASSSLYHSSRLLYGLVSERPQKNCLEARLLCPSTDVHHRSSAIFRQDSSELCKSLRYPH